jgi:acetyl-CoA carboxylase biotin carboxyl carrier protein
MAKPTKNSKNPSKAKARGKSSAAVKPASRNAGDFPEVRSLIDLLKKNNLAVLEFEKGDFRVTLKTPAGAAAGASVAHAAPAVAFPSAPPLQASETPAVSSPETSKGNYREITSPMVGTFYASPSPEAPAFVEVGKSIKADTVVCIIEAMKVMNEIKAEIAGKVVEVVAENGKPVQFGQVLFRVS